MKEAVKNLIKARVNGGISDKAYLKMGDPAPQMIVAVSMAIIPDMYSWYQKNFAECRGYRYESFFLW